MVITYIGSISVDSASYEHNSRGRGPGGVPVARILEVVGGDPRALGELETRAGTNEASTQLQSRLGVVKSSYRKLWETAPRGAILMK